MSSFNRVTLIGNLTRDPQVKHFPNSLVIAEFGLAMSRRYRTQGGEDREEVCFVDCTAFGKQAQVISEYARKGRQLFIEGRLKYDVWEDKSGHGKRSKLRQAGLIELSSCPDAAASRHRQPHFGHEVNRFGSKNDTLQRLIRSNFFGGILLGLVFTDLSDLTKEQR